jgi:hypothetical protein
MHKEQLRKLDGKLPGGIDFWSSDEIPDFKASDSGLEELVQILSDYQLRTIAFNGLMGDMRTKYYSFASEILSQNKDFASICAQKRLQAMQIEGKVKAALKEAAKANAQPTLRETNAYDKIWGDYKSSKKPKVTEDVFKACEALILQKINELEDGVKQSQFLEVFEMLDILLGLSGKSHDLGLQIQEFKRAELYQNVLESGYEVADKLTQYHEVVEDTLLKLFKMFISYYVNIIIKSYEGGNSKIGLDAYNKYKNISELSNSKKSTPVEFRGLLE